MSGLTPEQTITSMNPEQIPVPDNKLHGATHFLGLYAGEHVAATEFVIGATFVALGATTRDILIGLLIGNVLAILSWTLITAPIAVQTRLSLYTYLNKIAGDSMTNLYNWANVLIFTVISAAMITVSCSAVRLLFGIPAQLLWYPTSSLFVLIVMGVGMIVVLVAMYGFTAVAEFSSICGPWLVVMFTSGALVLFPALADSVLGRTQLEGFGEFLAIGDQSIWTGVNSAGEPGIGLLEVIGFAWAANTITHFGLIDMAILRFAKRSIYGLCSSAGMLFGHYIAWIAAGIMGAGTAALMKSTIVELDPGDVAYRALGLSGYVIVIIAGWTTANANLYRAGLAAQAIFHNHSRQKVTFTVGCITVVVACFPFVFGQMLPLLTYAGLLVVPVGAIVFAEHLIFPTIGLTRYWARYSGRSTPAVASWIAGLVFGFGLNALNVMSFFYLFISTWAFTIVLYTVLAKLAGAGDDYTAEVAADAKLSEAIKVCQTQQALVEGGPAIDNTAFSNVLKTVAWTSRDAGLPAFTVQSCDNIQQNGNLTRRVVLAFAERQDPELANWIKDNASFPNAMVDRITPVTTDEDIEYLEQEFGLHDKWPVTSEPFEQWVIEENFCNGRPEWERVGVHFVDDVTPYETMKLRLLNAGHSVLGLLGSIHGHATINECVADELFPKFLRGYLNLEATPTLDAVDGIDLDAYKDTLIERFGNPSIRDSVARICLCSSDKIPVFMVPTINANLRTGGSIKYAALVKAAWCYFCDKQTDRHGKPLEVDDLMKDELVAAARKTSEDRLAFLKLKPIFGDLADNDRFAKVYGEMVDALNKSPDVAGQMRNVLESE